MAINTSTITQLISDFRALSQKDSVSPESLGSRREPRSQRFLQRQRQRKTCRIGRRPPRNIVPTRAKLSLLKLCRVQPILCNTAPTAPTLSIHSTSERKNFRIGKVMLSRQREFCSGCERRSSREWACSACRRSRCTFACEQDPPQKFPYRDAFSVNISGVL